ncbi:MAG: hypothetical protein ACR2MX_06560, partial [Cyclobacteriaceae bacterium]
EVDNEVLIPAQSNYLRTGEFFEIKITEATAFDLIGTPMVPKEVVTETT